VDKLLRNINVSEKDLRLPRAKWILVYAKLTRDSFNLIILRCRLLDEWYIESICSQYNFCSLKRFWSSWTASRSCNNMICCKDEVLLIWNHHQNRIDICNIDIICKFLITIQLARYFLVFKLNWINEISDNYVHELTVNMWTECMMLSRVNSGSVNFLNFY